MFSFFWGVFDVYVWVALRLSVGWYILFSTLASYLWSIPNRAITNLLSLKYWLAAVQGKHRSKIDSSLKENECCDMHPLFISIASRAGIRGTLHRQ